MLPCMSPLSRRDLVAGGAAAAATLAVSRLAPAAPRKPDLAKIYAEVAARHDESVRRLQEWIRQASIAAENRGMDEGCELMMRLARDAGFQRVEKVPTDGQPAVFAYRDDLLAG